PQPHRSLIVGAVAIGALLVEEHGLFCAAAGGALVGHVANDAAPGGCGEYAPILGAGGLAGRIERLAFGGALLRRQDRSLGGIARRDILAGVAGAELRPLCEVGRVIVPV